MQLVDRRHLKTLAWMMVGLMQPAWSVSRLGTLRAQPRVYAQSLVRRFDRWLQNQRMRCISGMAP